MKIIEILIQIVEVEWIDSMKVILSLSIEFLNE